MHAFFLIVLAIAVPDRVDPNVKTPKSVLESLQGEWAVERGIKGGMELPPDKVQAIKFVFDSKHVQLLEPMGRFPNKGNFTLDTAKMPTAITMELVLGADGQPVTLLGILEVQDDRLTICYVDGPSTRPEAFASPAGAEMRLFFLKRIKK